MITVTLLVQLYWNHSLQWIFFFRCFRNLVKVHLRKVAEATCTCFTVMTLHSSSHKRCSIKIAILKIFAIFTGKHLCWNLFLIKLQDWRPTNLLKRDSNTGVFLWKLLNFLKQLFWKTSAKGCFCTFENKEAYSGPSYTSNMLLPKVPY